MSEKKWYVVRVVSGQENKIKAYIENEISRLSLDDFVDQILVPTEKVIQIRKGKKVQKEKVYFPGYIMVQANLSGEIPHIIKSIFQGSGVRVQVPEFRDQRYSGISNPCLRISSNRRSLPIGFTRKPSQFAWAAARTWLLSDNAVIIIILDLVSGFNPF